MGLTSYAIALGSNRRGRHGGPEDEVRAALALLKPIAVSPIVGSVAMGPSLRRYANAAAIVSTDEAPDVLLRRLKAIEHAFGRRRGRRWGARVIDLDIILWSEGAWASAGLIVPHMAFRERLFVLQPLAAIASRWRDPVTGLSVHHLLARLTRPRATRRAQP
ncbi:2-amino-4-hydroxy-6-hydroxymethyldihydropteridine diphosphokinase [Sphingomonas cannabina]|uniref:2-amino-4-hydroxy-6- hydroxymethyldihydropteridine diphosphokinase n=1 Tax=Sphingomonas cannabina TaxID=2899123 RepID=UPI001F473F80|nr:2-amino-4-hydroxy-6-hydroxymethyldihydropteridine diphosphokinase [Sphingomonas cannabina]UIJ45140.1 2-amino-4-hydroxy-6-hydroxymethyldihydropteridine diphosphokinase [Sphingomonas cannabina]